MWGSAYLTGIPGQAVRLTWRPYRTSVQQLLSICSPLLLVFSPRNSSKIPASFEEWIKPPENTETGYSKCKSTRSTTWTFGEAVKHYSIRIGRVLLNPYSTSPLLPLQTDPPWVFRNNTEPKSSHHRHNKCNTFFAVNFQALYKDNKGESLRTGRLASAAVQ